MPRSYAIAQESAIRALELRSSPPTRQQIHAIWMFFCCNLDVVHGSGSEAIWGVVCEPEPEPEPEPSEPEPQVQANIVDINIKSILNRY